MLPVKPQLKSLVTGGAGFIGSHVADELQLSGHEVVVLDDLSGGFTANVCGPIHFVKGSVADAPLIDSLFEHYRFDFVFHLAAYAAEGLSHFIRRFNYANNLLGSVTLINAAVKFGCRCFVFTSSIAVYGAGQAPMTEDMIPQPEDPYGISKYAVELDLRAARRQFGLDSIIFRPHNVYGERQNIGDKYRNVIGIFMNQVMQGLPCSVFGDGQQTRAFSYISDIAPLIATSVLVPEAYNQVFNIGADVPYSILELAEAVQKTMGRRTGIEFLPARNEVLHAFSDHSKARQILGANAVIDLQTGLERMAQWATKEGPRTSKAFGEIEVEHGLPSSWVKLCTKA